MKKIKNLLFVFLVFTMSCFGNDDKKYIELLEDQDFYLQNEVVFTGTTGAKYEIVNTDFCKFGYGTCYEVIDENQQNAFIKENRVLDAHKVVDENGEIFVAEVEVEEDIDIYEDSNISVDLNNTVEVEESKERLYTKFEKTFTNHVAYNHYQKAIELMYEGDHKQAYNEAKAAKAVYDTDEANQKIILPYIPGYIRESAQTPRRTYYKIVIEELYELKRLIRKIKLLNPPIPLVILSKTSTYIDVTVQNVGDTPLDNFVVEVNFEEAATFANIKPNESKTVRYNNTEVLEQISFREDYGFAYKTIEFTEE